MDFITREVRVYPMPLDHAIEIVRRAWNPDMGVKALTFTRKCVTLTLTVKEGETLADTDARIGGIVPHPIQRI